MEEQIPKAKAKTNGKRNREAGHSLERSVAAVMRLCGFPHTITSREGSKSRDDAKVDLMNKDEEVNGRLPYNIQAKNCSTSIGYPKLLSIMPKGVEYNVIIHNQTVKQGTRFMNRGQYAIMNSEDFFTMVSELERLKAGFKVLNDRFDCIPDEDKTQLHIELTKLGL